MSVPLPLLVEPGEGVFRHVELEINTACDLACFGCDRMSDVTTAPNMTVAQVALFVEESLDLKWHWERIRLLGGEPTLHPHFREMCELILEYKKHFPDCHFQVLSNGVGKYKQHLDWCRERGIDLHAEQKQKGVEPPWFFNTRITPVDRDPTVGEVPPCGIFAVRGCGIGLTRHGYFLDGAGAAVARVAGHDVGKMSLREVTWDAMREQAKILCRICGHWNPPGGERVTRLVSLTGKVTGDFWTRTLAEYAREKPVLRIYGEAKPAGVGVIELGGKAS